MDGEQTPRLVLVGQPNVGKSTLFNALTGGKAKVGNYPGVTVAHKSGEFFTPHGKKVELVDLPGCLSLISRATDEAVTRDVLLGEEAPDLVVVVLDASSLERHLPLALQVVELGLPTLVVLNKIDVAEANGTRVNHELLGEELGLPVVPLQADAGKGLLDLKQALRFPLPLPPHPAWQADGPIGKVREDLSEKLAALGVAAADRKAWLLLADESYRSDESNGLLPEAEQVVAEVTAEENFAELVDKSRRSRVRDLAGLVVSEASGDEETFSDRLDRFLLHPVLGWVFFLGIFFLVFWSLFSWSGIPMDWIDGAFGALGDTVSGALPPGMFTDLLVDGIIAGVGGVVIFLPQIKKNQAPSQRASPPFPLFLLGSLGIDRIYGAGGILDGWHHEQSGPQWPQFLTAPEWLCLCHSWRDGRALGAQCQRASSDDFDFALDVV